MSATIVWVLIASSVCTGVSLAINSNGDQTYIEDVEDPIEVQLPARDILFIAFCTEEPGNRIPSSLLDDLSLYFRHGSAIGKSGVRPLDQCIIVSTHVVNC